MTLSKLLSCLLFIISLPTVIYSQAELSFQQQIKDCYDNPKFQDFSYRLQNEPDCFIGLKFPEFDWLTIKGESINLDTIQNKVAVINFWFTACPPCLEEIPHFNQLIEELSHELEDEIVFIAPCNDDTVIIEKFLNQYGPLKSQIIPNSLKFFRNDLSSKSGFPTTFVLDKKGLIREYHLGGIEDFAVLKKSIKQLHNE